MKFPYGLCDFQRIILDGYFYVDRTELIRQIELSGDNLLFLRPRRFGKSLLLSMLENYYDLARADAFEKVFGNLAIGKNPTPLHHQYFILKWDFSCVDPQGGLESVKRSLFDHINVRIKAFASDYRHHLPEKIQVNNDNPLESFESLLFVIRQTPHKLYLLIDEYDNFANEIMAGSYEKEDLYHGLVQQDGPLKTLFKAVKAATAGEGLERIFITGVSPIVMSAMTSGYNISKDIYLDRTFHALCGFTENEIRNTLDTLIASMGLKAEKSNEALEMMRTYYNGYLFTSNAEEKLYNPTLALYFFDFLKREGGYPRQMLDANLSPDAAKLEYIAQVASGRQTMIDLIQTSKPVEISSLVNRFRLKEIQDSTYQGNEFIASFLYYFGVLTLCGETESGKLKLDIPNLVIQKLYVDHLGLLLLPEPMSRDEGKEKAELIYTKGDIRPLCAFVEEKLFSVFKNRDYRWMNEFTVKMAFLAMLYNDILYMIDSEPEIGRQYADMVMIIRPDMRRFKIFDVLIEFKYVKLGDAGLSGKEAKDMDENTVHAIPAVQSAFSLAKRQVLEYRQNLKQKYGEKLRLHTFTVVSLGFERLVWQAF